MRVLEGKHRIQSSRGFVTSCDHAGLPALAGEAYGVPEREYATNVGGLSMKDELGAEAASECRVPVIVLLIAATSPREAMAWIVAHLEPFRHSGAPSP
jgi:hypothetical protein